MILCCHRNSEDHLIKYQRAILLYRLEPIEVSYHPAKFGGHSHCGSVGIIILVCHVILQGHEIKEPFAFMGRSPSW